LGSGFHLIHSFYAFGTGGLTGQGLGESRQKLFYLPEPHTDFIFSILGEELGFLGVSIVAALFLFFMVRCLLLALRKKDLFGIYLTVGITVIIGLQAFINMLVVMGLLPTKGLTLPFISYGGTSLLLNLICVGILMNISAQSQEEGA
jgi:cell division protein FtsW